MIITLGRNRHDGKTAAVIEEINGVVYLNTYKQRDGMSDLSKLVESIELNDFRVDSIVEYYKRLKK